MASKNLKGLTIKIGGDTSDLAKALDGVEKRSRNLSGELGQINKLLKLDPSNTDLLAQKQKVLHDALATTREKLNTLREAEKQVQAQFERGEVSEAQYRALQREIIETENKLKKYQDATWETADAVRNLGKKANDTSDELKEQGKKTRETSDATEDLDNAASDLANKGLATLAAAATAAVGSIVALAEASREYRTEMAKLDTAFKAAGHSQEVATKTYEELQSVIGETDQAVEAAQQIALLAESEKDAAEWAELAAGVVGRFGDALQPETFYESANETLKLGEATGAYTQLLEGCGESVENFNEGLAACSTEQEKQEYMLNVTKKLLSSAAAQYRSTNEEVIRANEATEKWNQNTAKIGETVEPVVTDIKELGAALLEDASEPLEDTANFIRKDVLPAIKDAGNWVKKNGNVIKATAVGVTSAIVALKVASVAATVSQKGLKGAIMATTVAQKALTLAQSATPWGLVATGIAGVVAALVALNALNREAVVETDILTEAERELMEAADKASAAFRDQQEATEKAIGASVTQMGHTERLADELWGLADASGKVQEKDQERVRFILNELNAALDTEYDMVDGVIQRYDTLKSSIEEVMRAKLANALLETSNEDYITAIQNESAALENVSLKKKDYLAQKALVAELDEKAAIAYADYLQAVKMLGEERARDSWAWDALTDAEDKVSNAEVKMANALTSYRQAMADYKDYRNSIKNYEDAEAAALSGNYEKAVEILTSKSAAYVDYSDTVSEETTKVLDTLYKEAVDAGLEAERIKKHFQDGVAGYTASMVEQAETDYEDALAVFANAYADAKMIGEDIGDGLIDGLESKRQEFYDEGESMITGMFSGQRKVSDAHSPSRKAIEITEDIGEGAKIGLENKTEDVQRAATHQAQAVLDAYSQQEINAQQALRNVAEQQSSRYLTDQQAAASANGPMLEKILSAIERGQVIAIDGDILVGATAGKMDSELGLRRTLAARGAV